MYPDKPPTGPLASGGGYDDGFELAMFFARTA
jgi:hypothetical protein